jgi:CubicO group peptidase (beta-lactamase class C family)
MSAGFRWEENGPSTVAWAKSADFVRFTLELPLDAAPGERFNYNTGVAHLLSVVLTRAARISTKAFAERRLFGPIGA